VTKEADLQEEGVKGNGDAEKKKEENIRPEGRACADLPEEKKKINGLGKKGEGDNPTWWEKKEDEFWLTQK